MVDREYDYIRGNTALNPKRKIQEVDKRTESESKKRKQKENEKKAIESRKETIKNILQVSFVILVLGVATIARNGMVYRIQSDLLNVKAQMKTATAEGKALEVTLLKHSSLEDIKETANSLGMKSPEKSDFVVVDLTKDFFVDLKNKHK